MSPKRIWAKPLKSMFDDLVALWGGEAKMPAQKSAGKEAPFPHYYGNVNGIKFEVDISDFPSRKTGYPEDIAGREYLRIFVRIPTKYNMRITHEGFKQRIRKLFRLLHEFQTGNKAFDKKYFLKIGSKDDKKLLMDKKFQGYVSRLEPLALFEISPKEMVWSRDLTAESNLKSANVKKYVGILSEIAAMIGEKKPSGKRKPAKKKTAKAPSKTKTVKAPAKKKAAPKKVQCAGKTADGKRCKRMVSKPAKYCHLHKKKK